MSETPTKAMDWQNFLAIFVLAVVGSALPPTQFYCAVMAFAFGVRELSYVIRGGKPNGR